MPLFELIALALVCGLVVVGIVKGGLLLIFAASTFGFLILFTAVLVLLMLRS